MLDFLSEKNTLIDSNGNILSYEEQIKSPDMKRKITERWRQIGLLEGIQPNSKKEKMIIEEYERMAIFLVNNKNTNNETEWFDGVVFVLIRLLFTGEKVTGKRLHRTIKGDKLYNVFNTMTVGDATGIIKNNTPKSFWNRIDIISNLAKYRNIYSKAITLITGDDFNLSLSEINLMTVLFPSKNNVVFDFESEIVSMLSAAAVFEVNRLIKEKLI